MRLIASRYQPIGIVLLALAGFIVLVWPKSATQAETPPAAPLVQSQTLRQGNYAPFFGVYGQIGECRQATLRAT